MNNIQENNKLIAEFMGFEYRCDKNFIEDGKYWYTTEPFIKGMWQHRDLKFHYDWNWIMEVVKKIETEYQHLIYKEFKDETLLGSVSNYWDINEMYHVVVKFIKWYNDYEANNRT